MSLSLLSFCVFLAKIYIKRKTVKMTKMPKKKKESLKYKIVLKKMHNDTNFQDEELFNVELLVGGEDVVV